MEHQLLLAEGTPELFLDIVSNLEQFKKKLKRLSIIQAPPVLRARIDDKLTLNLTNWLHSSHSTTQQYYASVADGQWGVHPLEDLAVYYVPTIEQKRLIHMPLLFHEFGHILYIYHRPEMKALIGEFQEEVIEYLNLGRQRNDSYNDELLSLRQTIANTWYRWMIELYCDAVGFTIGGESYLLTFALYLRHFTESDFHLNQSRLTLRSHPLSWLRIQVLTLRAKDNGFEETAEQVLSQWQSIANALNIVEDYYGYYDHALDDVLIELLDCMVTEVSPIEYDTFLDAPNCTTYNNPVKLLDVAWKKYLESPLDYPAWEAEAVQEYLYN